MAGHTTISTPTSKGILGPDQYFEENKIGQQPRKRFLEGVASGMAL